MNERKERKTELWVNGVVILLATIMVFFDQLSSTEWVGIVGGIAGLYTIGRSIVKAKNGA